MENNFRKYLIGLSIFVLLFTLSCSKRESSTGATSPAASNSYTNAQSTLESIGLAISIPSISDFASSDSTNTASLTSVFGSNDSNTANFDTAKFVGLESAITDLQSSLSSYTSAPKMALSMSPKLTESYKNSDLAYIHFLLGYYYTLHAVLKLRVFVEEGIVTIESSRYTMNLTDAELAALDDAGRQAVLDAYFMLNGVRYEVTNSGGDGKIYADKTLPAGPTKCASYHLDQAIVFAGAAFPELKTALESLNTDSFEAFFSELAAKAAIIPGFGAATN